MDLRLAYERRELIKKINDERVFEAIVSDAEELSEKLPQDSFEARLAKIIVGFKNENKELYENIGERFPAVCHFSTAAGEPEQIFTAATRSPKAFLYNKRGRNL